MRNPTSSDWFLVYLLLNCQSGLSPCTASEDDLTENCLAILVVIEIGGASAGLATLSNGTSTASPGLCCMLGYRVLFAEILPTLAIVERSANWGSLATLRDSRWASFGIVDYTKSPGLASCS